jgi:hypothetical protein
MLFIIKHQDFLNTTKICCPPLPIKSAGYFLSGDYSIKIITWYGNGMAGLLALKVGILLKMYLMN